MGKNELFSFGDELVAPSAFEEPAPGSTLAEEVFGFHSGREGTNDETGVLGSRGESSKDSSERQALLSRHLRLGALLVAAILIAVAGIRIVAYLGDDGPRGSAASPAVRTRSENVHAAKAAPVAPVRPTAQHVGSNGRRAIDKGQARRKRAQTRRRARRNRAPRQAPHRAGADVSEVPPADDDPAEAETAVAPSEYSVPAPPESAPEPSQASPPPAPSEPLGEPHIHNGAKSPEFGL